MRKQVLLQLIDNKPEDAEIEDENEIEREISLKLECHDGKFRSSMVTPPMGLDKRRSTIAILDDQGKNHNNN